MYRTIAEHYDAIYGEPRYRLAYPFLHDLFRRRGPVKEILDVACGTFALDLALVRRGYHVTGRDLSEDLLRVARRNLMESGRTVDLAKGDMRTLRLGQTYDTILCLGTAFNYLETQEDVQKALRTFRRHLRPNGLLIVDLTNFDAWIRHPQNARAEVDYRARDGTRIAVFAFNEQNPDRTLHLSRFLTVVRKRRRIEIRLDEAPLRVWSKDTLARELTKNGFRPMEWWGDLRLGARYQKGRSPRLVAVAART